MKMPIFWLGAMCLLFACKSLTNTPKSNLKMKTTYDQYAACFTDQENVELKKAFFDKLSEDYDKEGRYYHTMKHVEALLKWSNEYAAELRQKEVVDLAIFYHDVIYDPTRRDNEEKSAERAVQELTQLNFPREKIELVRQYILATKNHKVPAGQENTDIAYMLDFDLSILGAPWEEYLTYSQNIRKEYQVIPDSLFLPGRMRLLQSFLDKPQIYYTTALHARLDAQARKNIAAEIQLLKEMQK